MNNLLLLILGLLALGILDFYCISVKSPVIEKDLLSRSQAVLRENHLPTTGLSFSGRDALLTGVKGAPEVSDAARQIVDDVPGVRMVDTEFIAGTVKKVSAVSPIQAKLDAALQGRPVEFAADGATLTPAGRAVLDRIIPILAAFPNLAIEIRGGPDPHPAAVKTYLVSKGIAPGRLTATSTNYTRPIEFAVAGGK